VDTVAEVMTHEVRSVRSHDLVGSVRDVMLEEDLHGVPVLDEDGQLAGIVTSSDLVEEWEPEQGVVTVMSAPVATTTQTATVAEAALAMLDRRVHHLVVVDGERVVGVVTSFDVLRPLARIAEAERSRSVPPRGRAGPGDIIVIRGHAVGQKERKGLIVEARGHDGGPPYVVNWLDDPHAEPHDVLFSPGSDASIEHARGRAQARRD
jgi:CBS domain containing-hemolysin-like protein